MQLKRVVPFVVIVPFVLLLTVASDDDQEFIDLKLEIKGKITIRTCRIRRISKIAGDIIENLDLIRAIFASIISFFLHTP